MPHENTSQAPPVGQVPPDPARLSIREMYTLQVGRARLGGAAMSIITERNGAGVIVHRGIAYRKPLPSLTVRQEIADEVACSVILYYRRLNLIHEANAKRVGLIYT